VESVENEVENWVFDRRFYVRDHPGAEPAIILMHGFPDNVHLAAGLTAAEADGSGPRFW
jgi:hypothetical protein